MFEQGSMLVLSRADRVVFSSLELMQVLPPNTLPSSTIILALSNSKMLEMENSPFSGLDLLERYPWSMMPPEAMLVSVVWTTH